MTNGLTIDDYRALLEEQQRHDQQPQRNTLLAAEIRRYLNTLQLGDDHSIWDTLQPGYGTHCRDCRDQGERRRYGSYDLCRACVHKRVAVHRRLNPQPAELLEAA